MKKIIFIISLVFSFLAEAQGKRNNGQVIIDQPRDITLPYKQRRTQYGAIFSLNMENFKPDEYFSFIKNENYEKLTDGKSIPLLNLEIGFKYNFSAASVSAVAGYARGNISNEATKLEELSAAITKLGLNLSVDGIMNEPYIAPYIQVGFHQIDWTERSALSTEVKEENFSSEWNYHYKFGASFQLNWIEKAIDESSAEQALRSSGSENTYLDIFYTAYSEPSVIAENIGDEGEANLASAQFGVGLKLEF